MKYGLPNGKTIQISDKEIENYMKTLELSQIEAIELWLTDHDYEVNEEQEELNEKAKAVKIQHDAASTETRKKSEKPRTVKVSDEKKELFSTILQNLIRCNGVESENIKVLTENKLIEVKIGEKTFKVDVIECRNKKKQPKPAEMRVFF